MSNDPKKGQSPGGAEPVQSLEDAVYQPSLAAGNKAINRGNPIVTWTTTVVTYGLFAFAFVALAKTTEVGKKALKTVGVSLEEQNDVPPPPPPPPPPAPVAAPQVVRKDLERHEPPPPPDPNKDQVPDIVPKELPKIDRSADYAVSGTSAPGAGVGVIGATQGTGQGVMGAGTSKVVDFDFSQIKIKVQPPAPPYPPMARIAKISGTVVVEIIIGPDGVPVSAHALEGPVQLRPTAESYAMTWRFEPAMLNGVPQTAKFKLTMPFKLK